MDNTAAHHKAGQDILLNQEEQVVNVIGSVITVSRGEDKTKLKIQKDKRVKHQSKKKELKNDPYIEELYAKAPENITKENEEVEHECKRRSGTSIRKPKYLEHFMKCKVIEQEQ